jgi:hypothetical protein
MLTFKQIGQIRAGVLRKGSFIFQSRFGRIPVDKEGDYLHDEKTFAGPEQEPGRRLLLYH